jgi:RND family efflux transporter MFP subunit
MSLLPAATLSAVALLLFAGCGRPSGGPQPIVEGDPLAVTTAVVEEVVSARLQGVTATVRPVNRASLSARLMGRVAELHVPIGASVRAGDPIITLDAGEIEARLQQARANFDQIERDLARETTLVRQGASSAEVARTLEDRRRAAAAAVREAETLVSYTTVSAPFDGVVTGRHVEVGDLAVPGAPLIELEGPSRLRAEAQVPESLAALAVGISVTVQLDDSVVTGQVAEFSPSADPATRTRLAKIELPAGSPARSGQFARVLWPAGEHRSLVAPASTVTRFGQMERVWIVADERAHLRLVRTGALQGDRIELLSGVSAGELLVVNPPAALRDGQRITR